MAKKPRTARGTAFGILNPYGDVWGYNWFHTKEEAIAHLEAFWRGTKDIDLTRFNIVPVRVTVSATQAPNEQPNAGGGED